MKVRSRGEGSIYKTKAGRYEVRISTGVFGGKRKRISLYAKSMAEAVKLLASARQQQGTGNLRTARGSDTVAQLLDRWLTTHVAMTRRTSTLDLREQTVRSHINPVIGEVRLAELTPLHVNQVLDAATGKGLSSGTVHNVRATMNAAFNRAVKQEILMRNVVKLTDARPVETQEMTPLDEQEAHAFIAAVKGHRYEALFLTAIYCGLRLSELLGLRWEDVETDVIQVRKQRLRNGQLGKLKTDKSRRVVALPAAPAAALKAEQKRQRSLALDLNEKHLCFVDGAGIPVSHRTLSYDFDRVLRGSGLPDIRFHDLRHTYATHAIANGVNIKVVSESLGHSNIGTTLNTYAHVLPSQRQATAVALAAAFG